MRRVILTLVLLIPIVLTAEGGRKIPNFSLRDIDGNKVVLDSILSESKVVMISFWAIYCKSCVRELTKMTSIYEKYGDEGFEVLAINEDGPRRESQIKPFVRSRKWKYRILLDVDGSAKKLLKVVALPTTFILDRDANLLLNRIGFTTEEEKSVEKIVEDICGDKDDPME